jgi:hypothetical protein
MIPQAITSAGPYADLWSHLKSMIHALNRALSVENAQDMTALDKERLQDLAQLLETEVLHRDKEGDVDLKALANVSPLDAAYTLGLDLRSFLKEIPEFEQWNAAQKLGTDKKLNRLHTTLTTYVSNLTGWMPNRPPTEEFRILLTILSAVLRRTESALQVSS